MRVFIVMTLLAVANADKLGYNYRPVGRSDSGLSFQPGSSLGDLSGGASLSSPVTGNPGSFGGASLGSLGAGSPGSLGNANLGNLGGGNGADYEAPSSYDLPEATLEKEFFTFTAPENEFEDPLAGQKLAGALNRGLRVIFIKGPENNGLENAALALAKQAADQQTAIYVLNKQADIGDLANKFNALRSNKNNKPDVRFIKYRTPEDAANAQRAIQAQYDGLGGSTQSHNGGVAPVLNFASQNQLRRPAAAAAAPENSYLPSSVFRLRY